MEIKDATHCKSRWHCCRLGPRWRHSGWGTRGWPPLVYRGLCEIGSCGHRWPPKHRLLAPRDTGSLCTMFKTFIMLYMYTLLYYDQINVMVCLQNFLISKTSRTLICNPLYTWPYIIIFQNKTVFH